MKRHIPNLITLGNLFLGCATILALLRGEDVTAFWCFFGSVCLDFADGLVARILGVQGPLGKELDSLADMVSFGVVPGTVYFVLLGGEVGGGPLFGLPVLGYVITLFSCLRLAKFNLDTRQTTDFIGLATPANTSFAIGLLFVVQGDLPGSFYLEQPGVLLLVVAVFSFLLVSEVRLFGGKFTHYGLRGNEFRYGVLVVAILEIIFFGYAAFALMVLTYLVFAVTANKLSRAPEKT